MKNEKWKMKNEEKKKKSQKQKEKKKKGWNEKFELTGKGPKRALGIIQKNKIEDQGREGQRSWEEGRK